MKGAGTARDAAVVGRHESNHVATASVSGKGFMPSALNSCEEIYSKIGSLRETGAMAGSEEASVRALEHVMGEALRLCFERPDEALEEIKRIERAAVSAGLEGDFGVHVLYCLAYGSLASKRDDVVGGPDDQVLDLCEHALCEYALARSTAEYEETERFSERVVVKPGGWFRKPVSELQERTRTVKKSRLDWELIEKPLDWICRTLEPARPGKVHELCGEVKFKYLAAAERVIWPPIMEDALRNDTVSRADLVQLGEVSLRGREPIGGVMVSWEGGGRYPKLMLSCFKVVDDFPSENAHCVDFYVCQKTESGWDARPLGKAR